MRSFRELRKLPEDARTSLATLDSGVHRANTTMTILAVVAVVALVLSTVALARVVAVAR